jgi:energy-coupling factor transporter ATP-binding protein EcfA2
MPNPPLLNAGGKKCITIATHDMRLIQELIPRKIVMDEDQVVENDLTKEILENEELLNTHGLKKL